MKKVIIVVILLFAVGCNSNYNEQIKIEFVKCVDGDTARFNINGKEEKVRFLGIDTPESTNIKEEYGVEASDYTCDVLNKANDIYIEYDANSDSRDKYDRILGWIFVDNNNLSELLLSKGYANVDYIYGDYKYIDELCLGQKNAYMDKLGIWNLTDIRYEDNYCFKNGY